MALFIQMGIPARAIDFKLSGNWVMSFGYGANGQFQGSYRGNSPTGWGQGQDNFEATQRLRLQLEAIASENLSGTVHFEIGDITWGQGSTGGALGADGIIVELMGAYIDWNIPDTPVSARMGIQNIATPAVASGNSVLNDQIAAVVLNAQINEVLGVTAFWGRPYNDNYPGWNKDGHRNYRAGFLDNIDVFGLFVPLTMDGFNLTPWGMYAGLGPNTFRGQVSENGYPFGNIANLGAGSSYYMAGMFPAGGARHKNFSSAGTARKLTNYGNAWWAGITGNVTHFEPVSVAFDFEYGAVNWQDDGRLNRAGWFASLLLEYHADWGIPALYGWYGSGDDSNPANGSERLPALDPNNANNYSYFAFDGAPWIERCAIIGNNMAGTWGIGARVSNLSFIEDVTHILRVNYIGGTNSPTMAKKMSLAGLWANGNELDYSNLGPGAALGMPGLYMTTLDRALEIGSTTNYQMYENLAICLEAAYVALWLDTSDSVWGARHRRGEHIPSVKDAWNVNVSFVYSF